MNTSKNVNTMNAYKNMISTNNQQHNEHQQ
jgi:hypothetical protein